MLGAGYGVCLVGGLLEVQRIAGPDELAGLNAVFYALTYVGFGLPIVLAELARFTSFTVLLLGPHRVGSRLSGGGGSRRHPGAASMSECTRSAP